MFTVMVTCLKRCDNLLVPSSWRHYQCEVYCDLLFFGTVLLRKGFKVIIKLYQ